MSRKKTDGQRKLAVFILANGSVATHEAGGKALLAYAAELARTLSDQVTIVTDGPLDAIQKKVGDVPTAKDAALPESGDVLVLPAAFPLLRAATLANLVRAHQRGETGATALVPELDAAPHVGVFRAEKLKIDRLRASDSAWALAEKLLLAGASLATIAADDPSELWEVSSIAELVAVDATLRAAKASALMEAGAVIYRPETCVIDRDVEVEAGAIIEPFVQLLGKTRIAAGARVRSYCVIENCTVGADVVILPGCLLRDGTIERGANIGPMTHMRPGCVIGEDAHLGAFVETKKTRLGKGVKAGHLAYLGDTEVGAGTNVGAGVITCNYDGVHKHKTVIGEGVFVGSDSTLVAPVALGTGSYVGAGSCITKDVPADALAVGRAHQVTKEGWAAARRARRQAKEQAGA